MLKTPMTGRDEAVLQDFIVLTHRGQSSLGTIFNSDNKNTNPQSS